MIIGVGAAASAIMVSRRCRPGFQAGSRFGHES